MLKRVAFLACSLMAVLCAACSTGGGTNGSHSTMLPAIAEPVRQAESAANDTAGLADVISIDAGGGAAVSNFVADTDYVGGTTSYPLGAGVVIDTSAANAAPAQLYRTTRESAGSFSYVIKANFVPNQPSVLRLHFAEVFGLKAAQRQFNVTVNYARVLTNFDIYAAAGNKDNTAVIIDIPVVPDATGTITVTFSAGTAAYPIVQGLEIYGVVAPAGTLNPASNILINSGGPATGAFGADAFVNGFSEVGSDPAAIDVSGPNTAPAAVYATYRTEPTTIAYLVTGLAPNTPYNGFLHFEEPLYNGAGKRVMSVSAGGRTITTAFDIFAAAGGKMHTAVALQVTATANAAGAIPITIMGLNGAPAIISGFELHQGATPATSPSPGPQAIYVAEPYQNSIAVFPAHPHGSVDEAPVATIQGSNTGLGFPNFVAVDASGKIYATNISAQVGGSVDATVTVYPANPTGTLNEAPLATLILGPAFRLNPVGIAIDAAGRIYVANQGNDSITVFAANPTGTTNATPIATIAGSNTALDSLEGIAVDAAGRIYVASDSQVLVFPANPTGSLNEAPVAAIYVQSLENCWGIALDAAGKVYVTSQFGVYGTVSVFPANLVGFGSHPALSVITGANIGGNAGFTAANGIAVDATGEIYVANVQPNDIDAFAANPIGSLAGSTAIGTIGGVASGILPTGFLSSPYGIAVH